MTKYSLLFLVLSMVICSKSFSQKQASDTSALAISKNVVYASLNAYMMAGTAISVNYDRKIINSLWVTTGIGKYPFLGDAFKVDLKLTVLIGNRSSHLEIALGVLYGRSKAVDAKYVPYHNVSIPYKPPTSYFYPAFTLGYRYQNPNGGIVFRAGIGFYETNVGLGFNF